MLRISLMGSSSATITLMTLPVLRMLCWLRTLCTLGSL
jgi:hypothetical protein